MGRTNDALGILLKARDIRPSALSIRRNLAKLYVRLGEIDNAITETRAALSIMPESQGDRYNLAVLFMEKGLFAEAESELEAVLSANPDDEQAKKAIKRLKGLMGDKGAIRP